MGSTWLGLAGIIQVRWPFQMLFTQNLRSTGSVENEVIVGRRAMARATECDICIFNAKQKKIRKKNKIKLRFLRVDFVRFFRTDVRTGLIYESSFFF